MITKNKIWISVSIICFSAILQGCTTWNPLVPDKMVWPVPNKPETKHVEFIKVNNGYLITTEEAKKLADNIDELKAYENKLEALVDGMKRYYNAR